MSKILITGGAGFIGYFLAKELSRKSDNDITIVDNLSRGKLDVEMQNLLSKKNIHFFQGDMTDETFFSQLAGDYEYIYHLAAIIGVQNVLSNPDKVLHTNAMSTINIFEFAKSCKNIKKVFFSSTSEVYAGTFKHFSAGVPTDENVPLALEDISSERTTYALSKLYGEAASFAYAKKHNIPVIIGRYHNIYGPRMGYAHVIPEMFLKISKSNKIGVASSAHTRAFCFIDDAVEFTIRICESVKAANEVINIGNSKEEISIMNLVIMIANIMGKRVTIENRPDTLGSPKRRCPNTLKIERLTRYAPKVPLGEGIRKTYNWYKEKISETDVEYEIRTR